MDPDCRGKGGRIDGLPEELRSRIDRLLSAGVSQVEILRRLEPLLADIGEPPISAAGLSRYSKRINRVVRRYRESREIAGVLTAAMGDRPAGEVSQHIIEILRTVAFDAALRAEDGKLSLEIEDINQLALAVQRLERASEISARRARDIRRGAADAAGKAAQQAGVSQDVEAAIRAAIEGA